jgi:PIN domain nuclease of toxin-antitoxin system
VRHRVGDYHQGPGIGKLPNALDVVTREGFQPLSLTIEHGQRAGGLPGPLRDPFDRMLIAQTMLENLHLVSIERTFDAHGVLRVW